jgi:hypothetical protein
VRLKRADLLGVAMAVVIIAIPALADEFVTQGANIGVDISRVDGRIALDLRGSIWILPARGGEAMLATDGLQQASRPRWSPDGEQILYQTSSAQGTSLWLFDIESSSNRSISESAMNDQFASWHPDGDRIVFASARNAADFDLWETDIPTGLSWRISHEPGDELEPVWSANGRDLAYIWKSADQYALMIRRRGLPDREVLVSRDPLSSLSWRPDGTLLTYLRDSGDRLISEMAILSEPTLVREFVNGEDYLPFPVSWQDRSRHVYTADGSIKTREFGDWRSIPLPFRAMIASEETRPPRTIVQRQLAVTNPSPERLVIRGARLFDGIWNSYRDNMDILIEGGKISAVEPRRDWHDATILDLGGVTILPGLIDSWSSLPPGSQQKAGATLLAYGVTSIVTDQSIESFEQALWDGEDSPGPRLIPAINLRSATSSTDKNAYYIAAISSVLINQQEILQTAGDWQDVGIPVLAGSWNTHVSVDADLLLGIDSLPRTSMHDRYAGNTGAGQLGAPGNKTATVISGLADAATPGLDSLLASRQARELAQNASPGRRHSVTPSLAESSALILAGSRPNGMPAGLALHAELRALSAAGLTGEQVLHAAGKNAATVLGLENQIGTITPGALADLVLVNGDPLNSIDDVLNIVAVVRNGRFFSLVRLLEQARAADSVE